MITAKAKQILKEIACTETFERFDVAKKTNTWPYRIDECFAGRENVTYDNIQRALLAVKEVADNPPAEFFGRGADDRAHKAALELMAMLAAKGITPTRKVWNVAAQEAKQIPSEPFELELR